MWLSGKSFENHLELTLQKIKHTFKEEEEKKTTTRIDTFWKFIDETLFDTPHFKFYWNKISKKLYLIKKERNKEN